MFTSINQAQEYLESFIRPTVFDRIEEDSHMSDPLDRMRVLLSLMGNPEKKFKSVQVSGTSGKGSTSYLIANMLTKAGYKTGLTISPHLEKIHERIQINMQPIEDTEFLVLANRIQPYLEQMRTLPVGEPSYFEILVALAFEYFAKQNVDIAIVEVGLEGKYDGTNVLDPLTVVITNLSKDHTELLGNTVEEIASEALSIIKKGEKAVPAVVTGITQPNILSVLIKKAEKIEASVMVLGKDISYTIVRQTPTGTIFHYRDQDNDLSDLLVSMRGEYQVSNACLAIAVTAQLSKQGFTISGESIRDGLAHAFFPGRFEIINYTLNAKPYTFVLDGAHNDEKMRSFLKAFREYYPSQKVVFILGFKKRKDIQSMMAHFKHEKGKWIVTQFHKTADYSRSVSMTLEELREAMPDTGKIVYQPTVPEAITYALQQKEEIVVVTGSLYLVGEVRSLLSPKELRV